MRKYFDKLESLRGLAAFAVVLYHSPFYKLNNPNAFVSNSYLFVDFFFILSGFVMTSAYKERIAEGFKLRDYFYLRLGRIYPLHFVFLICWAIYIAAKWFFIFNKVEFESSLLKNTFGNFITNLLLIHSLNIQNQTSWNYPSWSISVEFVAYFVFFGFAFLFRKSKNPLYALILCLASYYYLYTLTDGKTLDFTLINGIYRCLGGFFAGVFLFQATQKIRISNVYLTTIFEVVSILLIVWIVSNASEDKLFLWSVIPTFVFAFFVFSQSKDGIIGYLLKLKPFANAGKYSYSIYLTHALILDLAFTLAKIFIIQPNEQIYFYQTNWSYLINIGLVLTIYAISSLTYKLIEKIWIEKSKNYVKRLNEFDKFDEKKSIFV